MALLRPLLATAMTLAVTWILLVAVLAIVRPRGIDFGEAKRFVPDLVRLVRSLARDPELPAGVKRRLALLLAYLALPFDLVPDFVPVLGYADDVIIVALALRGVVRRAGSEAVERHWAGTQRGLEMVRAMSGIARRDRDLS